MHVCSLIRTRSARFVVLLFVILLFSFLWAHQLNYAGATPSSRLALLNAVLREGTLTIDRWHENTPDKAIMNGHYYSDKAPGTVALALPAVGVAMHIQSAFGIDLDSETAWLICSWVACAFSQALPAALGGTVLFVWLSKFVCRRVAFITVFALTLGSIPLPYCTLLFSHSQVFGLLSISIWALALFLEDFIPPWRMSLAGFCIGLALASEYTAGLEVVGLAGYALACRSKGRMLFLLWMCLPLLLIPIYSAATMGNPFVLPYSHQAKFPEMSKGIYAIMWPNLENFGRLMVGPTRGLVFWTPFLAMAGIGAFVMSGRIDADSSRRWKLGLTLTLPLLHVIVISGRTWDWQAGYTLSARYMTPILPLLSLPCALGLERWWRTGVFLATLSICMITIATLTDACPAYEIENPLTQLHIPDLLRGNFSYSLGELAGLSSYASVAVFYAVLGSGVAWLWRQVDDEETGMEPLQQKEN